MSHTRDAATILPQKSVLKYRKSLHRNSANVSFDIDNAKVFGYNNIKGW